MATGRCCWGARRITVADEPSLVATCHCDDCRRRTGSALSWSAHYPDAQVDGPAGDLAAYRPAVDAPQLRWSRRACGTTIAWRTGRFPRTGRGRRGAFVDEPLPPPNIANRSSACVGWLTLPGDWRHIA